MIYVGSKRSISKEIVPIIQSYITKDTKGYLEPFVGGCNIIDKIQCDRRIGCDIHTQLIALFNKLKEDKDSIPITISEIEYNEVKNNKDKQEDWYLGLVGFLGSFGAKYFGGYARHNKDDNTEAIQKGSIKNLKKQYDNLKDVSFINCNFLDLPKDKIKNYVIYCDIPYRGTTKYKTENFPYDEFYQWCKNMSVHNIVLISEYNMPDDFDCIWSKETKVNFDSNRKADDSKNIRVEKLFTYKTN